MSDRDVLHTGGHLDTRRCGSHCNMFATLPLTLNVKMADTWHCEKFKETICTIYCICPFKKLDGCLALRLETEELRCLTLSKDKIHLAASLKLNNQQVVFQPKYKMYLWLRRSGSPSKQKVGGSIPSSFGRVSKHLFYSIYEKYTVYVM